MLDWIRRLPPRAELIIVNVLCFGFFAGMSAYELLLGARAHVFDDAYLLLVVAIEVVTGLAALSFLRLRGWKWSDFNLRVSMPETISGSLLFVFYTLIGYVMYQLAAAIAGPDFTRFVKVETRASLAVVLLVIAVNPLFEELFEVAYNTRALEEQGAGVAITTSAVIRFVCHLYQGPVATVTVLPIGLLFAFVYWRWRRLWPLVVAHGLADWFGLTQLG